MPAFQEARPPASSSVARSTVGFSTNRSTRHDGTAGRVDRLARGQHIAVAGLGAGGRDAQRHQVAARGTRRGRGERRPEARLVGDAVVRGQHDHHVVGGRSMAAAA